MIPNTCQVPNVILDQVMPQSSHAEFKVVMAVVRKTYGWGKETDRISLSQLVKMTGVSKPKVIDAVRHLDWLIVAHKTAGGTTEYSLNIDVDTGHLFNSGVGHDVTQGGAREVVNSVHQDSKASSPAGSKASLHTKPTLKPTKQNTC
jgi:phage replication O-like protein O